MLERNKIESLILILSLILLAGLVYSFGNIVMILIPALQQELGMTIVKFLSMTLGFIVIPTWIVKKINLDIKNIPVEFNKKSAMILLFSVFLLNLLILRSHELYTALIVATCEEYLFRYLLYGILVRTFNKNQAIIITAVLFGVLLHLNGNLLVNIFTKIPAGIILSQLAVRFGLQYSISFHWLYNMIVGRLF